ncbi:hypothetical protein [Paenibacillus riograndensis]|uniref:Uncharacterized protein n=1 Tax=Paenibacillus riograndensis SBR5 TaxID=1073571 RepID=A0A0E4CU70_9BACL|nr:hypothetical protein [Paenibacillus riograndensis]CQR51576.1 hypothetical protein PRIO_0323 [Paenibacillus riograndensis SBR5]
MLLGEFRLCWRKRREAEDGGEEFGWEGKQADSFADIQVKYDNQYEYVTFSTLEDNGGEDFTYSNITNIEPLKNGTLVYLAEVPDEVQSGDKPLYAEVNIEGEIYRYTIR